MSRAEMQNPSVWPCEFRHRCRNAKHIASEVDNWTAAVAWHGCGGNLHERNRRSKPLPKSSLDGVGALVGEIRHFRASSHCTHRAFGDGQRQTRRRAEGNYRFAFLGWFGRYRQGDESSASCRSGYGEVAFRCYSADTDDGSFASVLEDDSAACRAVNTMVASDDQSGLIDHKAATIPPIGLDPDDRWLNGFDQLRHGCKVKLAARGREPGDTAPLEVFSQFRTRIGSKHCCGNDDGRQQQATTAQGENSRRKPLVRRPFTGAGNAARRQPIDQGLSWPAAVKSLSGRGRDFKHMSAAPAFRAFVRHRRRDMIQLLAAAATKPD